MTSKIVRYIWTFPMALAILLILGEADTLAATILRWLALVLAGSGIVGYIVDVVWSSIKSKHLVM